MKFAAAKQKITPNWPVFLAGYGGRDRKNDGVLDDIYAKVAFLAADRSLLIITFDALGGDRSFVNGLQAAVHNEFGLDADQVLINFSHTHCSLFMTGEDPVGRRGGYSMGQQQWPERDTDTNYDEDIRYFRFIRRTIVGMVRDCMNRLTEGAAILGHGISKAGISRRFMEEDGLKFKPNPDAETDKDLFVLQLIDGDSHVEAVLFSYGCHPNCIGRNMISADFVGRTCTQLEAAYPGSVALFLQGCGADIKPAKCVNGEQFKACSYDEMLEAGTELADDVLRVLQDSGLQELGGSFVSRLTSVRLFTEPWGREQIAAIAEDETKTDYKRRAARRVLQAMERGEAREMLPYYIQTWQLGNRLLLVALEGETPSELSLRIKRLFPEYRVIVLGYSNGVPTYIPTKRILAEGGYEAEAFILHGFRGPFVPENDSILLGAVMAGFESIT